MTIFKLGIIAGGGSLPQRLVDSCLEKGIEPYLVCFDGHTSKDLPGNLSHIWVRLGAAGKIIDYFKSNGVYDLVLIGHIKRPSFKSIVPDWRGFKILSKIGTRVLGDNSLLSLLRSELESDGLKVHGIQDFCDDLLVSEGAIGQFDARHICSDMITLGIKSSQDLGRADLGQSVIVQGNNVIGREDDEGTDSLIARCAPMIKGGEHDAILVKSCKPQQDKSLDLPTIGLKTIENAYEAGLCGIVLHADHVILTDRKAVAEYADRCKIFVVGVRISEGV